MITSFKVCHFEHIEAWAVQHKSKLSWPCQTWALPEAKKLMMKLHDLDMLQKSVKLQRLRMHRLQLPPCCLLHLLLRAMLLHATKGLLELRADPIDINDFLSQASWSFMGTHNPRTAKTVAVPATSCPKWASKETTSRGRTSTRAQIALNSSNMSGCLGLTYKKCTHRSTM